MKIAALLLELKLNITYSQKYFNVEVKRNKKTFEIKLYKNINNEKIDYNKFEIPNNDFDKILRGVMFSNEKNKLYHLFG